MTILKLTKGLHVLYVCRPTKRNRASAIYSKYNAHQMAARCMHTHEFSKDVTCILEDSLVFVLERLTCVRLQFERQRVVTDYEFNSGVTIDWSVCGCKNFFKSWWERVHNVGLVGVIVHNDVKTDIAWQWVYEVTQDKRYSDIIHKYLGT